ncbi:MAG: hypothetical protein WCB46_12545 [Methanoregula sp.]
MKTKEFIVTLLAGSTRLGTYMLSDLITFAQSESINGIAVAVSGDREFYLALEGGEPEGAILIDEKGTLYGDKAVMLLSGAEKFKLYEVKPELVESMVMGSRILEKGHIRKNSMEIIPEIGKKSNGLGVLSVAVRRNGEPQNGVRISIRKDGQAVGDDITTQNGTVSFRLLYGIYDGIVQDRAMRISSFSVIFDAGHSRLTLEI